MNIIFLNLRFQDDQEKTEHKTQLAEAMIEAKLYEDAQITLKGAKNNPKGKIKKKNRIVWKLLFFFYLIFRLLFDLNYKEPRRVD